MSLQDDYYDLKNILSSDYVGLDECYLGALERIWFRFCDYETQEMVRRGEISEEKYNKWYENRTQELYGDNVLEKSTTQLKDLL